jgi:hypothetical protein
VILEEVEGVGAEVWGERDGFAAPFDDTGADGSDFHTGTSLGHGGIDAGARPDGISSRFLDGGEWGGGGSMARVAKVTRRTPPPKESTSRDVELRE